MSDLTSIDNFVFDKIAKLLHPSDFLVYMVLWRWTHGMKRERVTVSLSHLSRMTGLSKNTVATSIKSLTQTNLVTRQQDSLTATSEYEVLRPWAN